MPRIKPIITFDHRNTKEEWFAAWKGAASRAVGARGGPEDPSGGLPPPRTLPVRKIFSIFDLEIWHVFSHMCAGYSPVSDRTPYAFDKKSFDKKSRP